MIPRKIPADALRAARCDVQPLRRQVRLPDLIIVDGGKGQLSSACRELQRLGLHELPIIGLAKEFEEIYRPGAPAAAASAARTAARCRCSSASATKRIASPTATTNS